MPNTLRQQLLDCHEQLDDARSSLVHVGCDKDCTHLRRENFYLRMKLRGHSLIGWVPLVVWIVLMWWDPY